MVDTALDTSASNIAAVAENTNDDPARELRDQAEHYISEVLGTVNLDLENLSDLYISLTDPVIPIENPRVSELDRDVQITLAHHLQHVLGEGYTQIPSPWLFHPEIISLVDELRKRKDGSPIRALQLGAWDPLSVKELQKILGEPSKLTVLEVSSDRVSGPNVINSNFLGNPQLPKNTDLILAEHFFGNIVLEDFQEIQDVQTAFHNTLETLTVGGCMLIIDMNSELRAGQIRNLIENLPDGFEVVLSSNQHPLTLTDYQNPTNIGVLNRDYIGYTIRRVA